MKKIKFSALFTVLFATISLTSCSSDDTKDTNEISEPVETSTGDYWPMAMNNQWTMSQNGDNSTMKIIGTDNFGGTTYYKLSASVSGEELPEGIEFQQWIAKKGATYYEKLGEINMSMEGMEIKMDGYEMAVLKDNLAVGDSWNGSFTQNMEYKFDGDSMTMKAETKYTGTILEKGISVTVNDKLYPNVIRLSLAQEVTVEGEKQIVDSEYWYANGVGPIKYINTSDGESVETILIDYIINK